MTHLATEEAAELTDEQLVAYYKEASAARDEARAALKVVAAEMERRDTARRLAAEVVKLAGGDPLKVSQIIAVAQGIATGEEFGLIGAVKN